MNDSITLTIEKLSSGGDGIARVAMNPLKSQEKYVVFVPYTLPGEKVEAIFTENKKNFGRALPIRILEKNPTRIEARCPLFFHEPKKKWCGGCNFQHLNATAQLEQKRNLLQEALTRIGSLPNIPILPPLGASNENENWRFRNKIQIPFGFQQNKVVSGFYAPHSHDIIPLEDCLIQSEDVIKIVRFITQKMNDWNIEPYSEATHRGWLRHLFIRESFQDHKQLLTFVTAEGSFPKKENWIAEITRQFPSIVGLCQNMNPAKTNVILGREWKTLWGQDFLLESLPGLGTNGSDLKLKVSAPSFFQVNLKMAEQLYATVRNFLCEDQTNANQTVLDLYCGVGGISLTVASTSTHVIGIDEVPSSILDAKENSVLNSISNCEFHRMDAAHSLKELARFLPSSKNLALILDPPRSGCEQNTLEQILTLKPSKIIYVSCEPTTLARDLKVLSQQGYHCKKVQPVDLFPQSSHIESVSLITP